MLKKTYFKHNKNGIGIPSYIDKKIILLISVGQPYHESKYLSAVISLINKENFGFCTIAIADTLQRHNYSLTLTLDNAYELAKEKGKDWKIRNSAILSKLNVENEVISWDYWLAHPLYLSFKEKINFSYSSECDYRNSIDITINSFTQRLLKRQPELRFNEERFKILCLEYIKEECAIIMPLWASLGYDFIIYPKPMTIAMETTYNKFVDKSIEKVNWLSLLFKS